jgi:hypothetical protein
MVTLWPAISIEPVRAGPGVGSTLTDTAPVPLPVAPPVTETHGTLLAAVHGQPAGAVTEN